MAIITMPPANNEQESKSCWAARLKGNLNFAINQLQVILAAFCHALKRDSREALGKLHGPRESEGPKSDQARIDR